MFCPGCGAPHSKHATQCAGCERDLTVTTPARETYAKRQQGARVLLARQEAALMQLPAMGKDELPETFIRRVTRARTEWLERRVREQTVDGIGARA